MTTFKLELCFDDRDDLLPYIHAIDMYLLINEVRSHIRGRLNNEDISDKEYTVLHALHDRLRLSWD